MLFLSNKFKGSIKGGAAFLVLVALFSSCSTTQEMRRSNRASKKLNKLAMKYPELLQADTIRDTVEAIVNTIRVDTSFAKADTIYLQKDRLKVRIITEHDTVRILGECLGDTIYVPFEVAVEKIQPVQYKPMPQRWWELALQSFGMLFLFCVAVWLSVRAFRS